MSSQLGAVSHLLQHRGTYERPLRPCQQTQCGPGRYAIEREIGEGEMPTVYLAEDLRHERKVALKVLKPELAAVVEAKRFSPRSKRPRTSSSLDQRTRENGERLGFVVVP